MGEATGTASTAARNSAVRKPSSDSMRANSSSSDAAVSRRAASRWRAERLSRRAFEIRFGSLLFSAAVSKRSGLGESYWSKT